MIGIEMSTGEFLELSPEMQYAFDQTNPAFQEDFESGDHTFPIDIPALGKNELLLNIPAKLNNFAPVYSYDVFIWLAGNRWKPGRLKIDRPGTQQHGAYILTGVRSFDSLDKTLPEIPMGGDHVFGNTSADIVSHANATVLLDINDTEYNFPTVRNDSFYGDTNPDWEFFINRWDYTSSTFLTNEFGSPGDPVNKDSLVPMPYVFHVLKWVFDNEGFILKDSSGIVDLSLDVIYNNRPLDSRSDYGLRAGMSAVQSETLPASYGGAYRVEFDDISTAPNHDTLGGFNIATYKWTVPGAGLFRIKASVFIKVTSVTGFVYRVTFRMALGGNGNFAFLNANNIDPLTGQLKALAVNDIIRLDIDRVFSIDSSHTGEDIQIYPAELNNLFASGCTLGFDIQTTSFLEITDLDQSTKNVYTNIINLQNHVPDVSVKDFLKFCMVHYNIYFDFDVVSRTYYIKSKASSITPLTDATDIDITSRSEPDHEKEIGTDRIKSFGFNWPGDDALLSDNFKSYDKQNDIGAFNSFADFPTPVKEGLTALDLETNIRYITGLDVSLALEWQYYTDQFEDLIIDPDGTIEVKDNITPLMMRNFDTAVTGDIICPQIEQEGDNPLMGVTNDRISSIRVVKYYGFPALPVGTIADPNMQDLNVYWTIASPGFGVSNDTYGPGPTMATKVDTIGLYGEQYIWYSYAPLAFYAGTWYRVKYKLYDITAASTIRFSIDGANSPTISLAVQAGESSGYIDIFYATVIGGVDFYIYVDGQYFLTEIEVIAISSNNDYPLASSMSMGFDGGFAFSRNMWNDPTSDLSINTSSDKNLFFNYITWIRFMNITDVFVKNINFDINDIIKMFQYASGISYQRRIEGVNIVFKKLSYTVEEKVLPTRAEFIIVPWT